MNLLSGFIKIGKEKATKTKWLPEDSAGQTAYGGTVLGTV